MQTAKLNGELLAVYIAFLEGPATMRMVEVSTGILRPNICRYVAKLKKKGLIRLLEKDRCPHTRHHAGFYTAQRFPNKQLQWP